MTNLINFKQSLELKLKEKRMQDKILLLDAVYKYLNCDNAYKFTKLVSYIQEYANILYNILNAIVRINFEEKIILKNLCNNIYLYKNWNKKEALVFNIINILDELPQVNVANPDIYDLYLKLMSDQDYINMLKIAIKYNRPYNPNISIKEGLNNILNFKFVVTPMLVFNPKHFLSKKGIPFNKFIRDFSFVIKEVDYHSIYTQEHIKEIDQYIVSTELIEWFINKIYKSLMLISKLLNIIRNTPVDNSLINLLKAYNNTVVYI